MFPKIVFSPGHRGLGHVMRDLEMAKEIKRLQSTSEIIFLIDRRFEEIIKKVGFKRITYDLEKWNPEARKVCVGKIRDFGPDIIVSDGTPIGFAIADWLQTRSVFVFQPFSARDELFYLRIFCRFVDAILIPVTEEFAKIPEELEEVKEKVHLTGPMLRRSKLLLKSIARKRLKVKLDQICILITAGGGLYGPSLLLTAIKSAALIRKKIPSLKMFIIIPPSLREEEKNLIRESAKALQEVSVTEFVNNIDLYYSASDLVVTHAGANTILELASCEKPMIIVPGKNSYEQTMNARRASNLGMAKVIQEETFNPQTLADNIFNLAFNDEEKERMKKACRFIVKERNGATKAARVIIELSKAPIEGD